MKKVKASSSKTLPADFTSTDVPKIDSPKVAVQTDSVTLPVPEIDQDAKLKIDEAQMQPEELPEAEKEGKHLFFIGTFLGIVIIAGTIVLSIQFFKAPTKNTPVTQETVPTPVITETVKSELIKTDFNFEVLNASGISGQAGKTKSTIENVGYVVSSIGNASSHETKTKLLLKASMVSQKDLLISDLQKILPGIVYDGEFDSETANARVIIGE